MKNPEDPVRKELLNLKKLFVVTTVTLANKGKVILRKNGIPSEVRKTSGGTAAGCLFGLAVRQSDFVKAETVLKENGIRTISVKDVAE